MFKSRVAATLAAITLPLGAALAAVPAATAEAACSLCLVIYHDFGPTDEVLPVAQDSTETCANSNRSVLYQGRYTNVNPPGWPDAGCYYLASGLDARVRNNSSGEVTWQYSTGWKRLAECNCTKSVLLVNQ